MFANLSKKIDQYFEGRFLETQSFSDYIDEITQAINEACKQTCKDLSCQATKDMEKNLYKPYTSFVLNAGKRTRPALTLLAASLFTTHPSIALSSGVAIEHFHSAALIHDDIADNSKLRRGQVCMHLQIGEGLAINCGDFGLNFMPGIILGDISLPSEKKLSILREINDMARRTIEGQALDIGWAYEDNYNITIDDYTAMARCKTSYYSAATPLVCGAIAANANDTTKQVLMKFGLDVGLAFQIQDDILNLIGDNSDTGKGECDDIAEGKRTLIVIHALNNAKKDDRHRLCELLSSKKNTQSDISEALSIINSSSSIEYASDYANKLIADSVSYLCENINKNHALDIVVSMANWALTRKR